MTATLTTLVGFNGAAGTDLRGSLIVDANGDLFGTTNGGGANNDGTVFEIAKTAAGYASTPTALVTFDVDNGEGPEGGLIADASGDLLGTTAFSPNGDGTVFEIVKTASGYASTPTTLASFDDVDGERPEGSLVADANGDLFGTTEFGGPGNEGVVFEIAKTPTGYSSTPDRLVSFNGPDGANPQGNLVADANGDLFGTTNAGGPDGLGTVFEIAKTSAGYAGTPTTLVSFPDTDDGFFSDAGLIADANGDLFGTTSDGGAIFGDGGVVFEIKKTAGGYASTSTTLVNFTGADGETPMAGLLIDANGDLFGTTYIGGSDNLGTVFEIKRTGAGYASTPTVLASFNGTNGDHPMAGLVADANGNLFGTTQEGGPSDDDIGTVFEITGSGFVPVTPPPPPLTGINDILFQKTNGQEAIWDVSGGALTSSALLGADPGPNWKDVGTGAFNDDMVPDILLQNTNGSVAIWETDGTSLTTSAVVANPGPNWRAVGTGDFNDDQDSDILLQNKNGSVAVWDMNETTIANSAVVADPGPNWKAVGTGDFNADHHSDILLQNKNGSVAVWDMNENERTIASSAVVADPGPNWHAIGTGDFNADGHSDILLQNTNGSVAIWDMSGTTIASSAVVADPGPNWHAIGTGGAGSPDILFQNTSGQTAIWDMNGTNIAGSGTLSANPGTSWRAVGLT